jgi:hypothetical protein
MHDKHWTDDELIARFYEVRPEDKHLATCRSCARRLDAMRSRYQQLHFPQPDASPEFLAAQRRAIHARIRSEPFSFHRILVPAIVTLLAVTILIIYRPFTVSPPAKRPISDSELFEDVFNRISDPLPSSAYPIRSLFEEQK